MFKLHTLVAVMGGLAFVPGAVSAQSHAVRQVQLISMGSPANNEPLAARSAVNPAPTLLPEAFRVHDLSRRYVEYRMAQEMTGPEPRAPIMTAPESGYVGPIVAAVSSIAVPGWMKGAYPAIASTPYTPGCAPQAYRPSGFLRPDAEVRRAAYYGMMSTMACEHGIPTGLFDAMIIQESRYNPVASSPKRAFGLAQLMPGTAAQLGVNPYDPTENLRGGARYLRAQLDRFGQVHLALAAYNAGPGRIKGGVVPRIRETQSYVSSILDNWSRLRGYGAVAREAGIAPSLKDRTVAVSAF
jgi:soluble lytic murein transglycosylase-like protein